MGILHFLDVGQGDCSVIQPTAGRLGSLMIGRQRPRPTGTLLGGSGLESIGLASDPGATLLTCAASSPAAPGLLGLAAALQVPTTENPISYMRDRGMTEIFRFILTHPDMDHMDGIKDLFGEFSPANFWDMENRCSNSFSAGSPYREEDWRFYTGLRDRNSEGSPKRLILHSGDRGPFYNRGGENDQSHDGLHVLAPTQSLVEEANRTGDFNDASYVILYRSAAGRILFCGDSHDKTWEYLLANHLEDIRGVELMIAPHHGRDSDRDRAFLSEVSPKFTLFGRAPSEHLAYDAWRNRDLAYITCNQTGTVVVDTNGEQMQVYVTKESFARERNAGTWYSPELRAWHLGYIA